MPLGARVSTKNPKPWEFDDSLPEPDQSTWGKISITMFRSDGGIVDAEILRPQSWIARHKIVAGQHLPMNIEELQVHGSAFVTAVDDCPEIARGEGSVVTARFITREVNSIVRAEIVGPDGEIEVIEGTPIHPIWSVDRNDWVELSELQQSEQLLAQAGPATVLSVAILWSLTAVYNIEVHGEHVYQVGELGVLVHNTYPTNPINGIADALRQFPGSRPMEVNRLANLGGIPGGRQSFDPGKLERMGAWNWNDLDEPIQLIRDNGILRIQGGFTRIEAALRAGVTHLPVVIR